jgi:hypothetical protein
MVSLVFYPHVLYYLCIWLHVYDAAIFMSQNGHLIRISLL